ncbi:MAG TPA: DNA repair protein RadC [Burkholderiaceae bacterium]|nr:DNA repair protein RadC [Burkholderiaceae bacterium]
MKDMLVGANPERPRERLLAHGAHVLTTAELLAIILRTGVKGRNAIAFSHDLIKQFDGLRALLSAEASALMAVPGMGLAKTTQLLAINELNRRAISEALQTGQTLNKLDDVKRFCITTLGHLKIEHCIALFLDSQYRLITSEELSRGTLNQASVYPREIIKSALRNHAAALILAHNHPSGLAEPSQADLSLTRHLKQALSLVDITLLDHLIVTGSEAISLAERGQV